MRYYRKKLWDKDSLWPESKANGHQQRQTKKREKKRKKEKRKKTMKKNKGVVTLHTLTMVIFFASFFRSFVSFRSSSLSPSFLFWRSFDGSRIRASWAAISGPSWLSIDARATVHHNDVIEMLFLFFFLSFFLYPFGSPFFLFSISRSVFWFFFLVFLVFRFLFRSRHFSKPFVSFFVVCLCVCFFFPPRLRRVCLYSLVINANLRNETYSY